ncbi:peptidoglycan-binding protein [Clostridium butyricum]|uniref:peptidoglycan-binding domain-containing protein n=1 Tax=Clostridium butyricum TaxID=1492 RepID=UPI001CA88BCF|nr:peptidoglycan-binding domain-containing protein [Clostridium butyricum]MBZ0314755.1 peptidoglycan-binding protein [Clostridium butyricum]
MKTKKIIISLALITVCNSTLAFATENTAKTNTGNNVVATSESTENVLAQDEHSISDIKTKASYPYAKSVYLSGPTLQIVASDNGAYFIDITCNNVGKNCANDTKSVKMCQMLLNHYGYGLAVDGICGSSTKNAIYDYQKNHGLSTDYACGYNTWKSLYNNF